MSENTPKKDPQDRKQVECFLEEFLSLSESEQRERIRIEPCYRDYYNELVKPNQELRVPSYFMKNWASSLSTGSTVLYLYLRLMCFYDLKNPQNSRDYCWPKQKTLADLIGCGERSVRRYLAELEEHDLIRRKPTYAYDKEKGKKVRSVDVYQVPYELPLVTADLKKAAVHEAEEIIRGQEEHHENKPITPTGQNGRQVSYPPPTGQNGLGTARPNWPTEVVREDILTNVQTFGDKNPFKEENAYLVDILGQKLGRAEENHRFYEAVCYNNPANTIMQALAAVEDKFLDSLDPSKEGFRINKAAYFTGVLKNLKKKET